MVTTETTKMEIIQEFERLLGRKLEEPAIQKLEKAIQLAEIAYEGLYRKSGEPFISHPIEVAKIVADLKLDVDSLVAAILHDAIEDSSGRVTYEMIEKEFGKDIALIVDGVTKVSRINAPVGNIEQKKKVETIQKMLFAMAEDVRVIFVKLADRLHNMRTIDFVEDEEKRRYKAMETLEVYAPIAHKLGINVIRSELEDLSFKVLHYDEYQRIKNLVAQKKVEREERLTNYIQQLQSALQEHDIDAFVEGRYKHYYSIWNKMIRKGRDFNELYDLLGMRIIVTDVTTCYTVVGIIHSLWVPLPGRFKDYIATPKSNGYRSIHTTVVTQFGEPLEIQIRDQQMHEEAEYGLIAHWAYKEGHGTIDMKQEWLVRLAEWRKELSQGYASLDDLKRELQMSEVFVLTPKGEIIHLPYGATPIDFAYAVHTEIGHHYGGARVNGKIVPIDHQLSNGDVVEIIVNKVSPGPSLDWLRYAKSPRTKAKIKRFFKEKEKEQLLERGKDVLRRVAKKINISIDELLQSQEIQKYQSMHQIDEEEFTTRLGDKSITQEELLIMLGYKEQQKKKVEQKKKRSPTSMVLVDGLETLDILFAKCCNPIPGDSIVGVSSKRGLVIHRSNCRNVIGVGNDRKFPALWRSDITSQFGVVLKMEIDRKERVPDILSRAIEQKIEVRNFKFETIDYDFVIISMNVAVRSLEEFKEVIYFFSSIPGVRKVVRS
ncbi:MAG TPA: bifunctional (p)ppGpp synthetase/guanosine-3',5'-bis(diphosphate) 3'-pyrophosphohydrolase [Fervidobacterium sp.]|nr:bifunctional (p)ppGpp synthetase/guanosine-3',5'-bis(diphosphate) 3'-pyrophosphohydrolase [Fervidobacterium sp.]HOK87815.1 bifunctional (p)ppGpp synthetase/guanosine-3',5'-bis(diphosphate) 3'-pyrophosphohydrolase [Fervidobacterium sp.]HOM74031.1 bifunctional (p)ppGpp synthetase/guanosine-3',5'-bis(diphosphate) 3'-pyrophosphohydrolase [Fervidobacterium sp.]HPP17754.1 bifunctional (p)ppGpp synthetase/guanosine-3',5'-bis(diphosphate) 3'-pyrophosphohydrolase [Fervidobacterium sp.]HRD19502.1 bifu